jgi:hypothetical protein
MSAEANPNGVFVGKATGMKNHATDGCLSNSSPKTTHMTKAVLSRAFMALAFLTSHLVYATGHPETNRNHVISSNNGGNIPPCEVSLVPLTNIRYIVMGQTFTPTSSTLSSVLRQAVQQGKPLKVCFTVPASAGYKTYSLVSYKAPYAVYSRQDAHLQTLFDYKSKVVGPDGGDFCLEINLPDCYFQVDFVRGCIIEKLGPANTNNFYGDQGRLIAAANNGNKACTPPEVTGNEGCTPGYWKQEQHFGSWAPFIPEGANATKFFDVFTVCDLMGNNCTYRGLPASLTLLEALKLQGGQFNALARHAAAAYLNAKNPDVDYSYSSADVVAMVVNAFKTGSPEATKNKLDAANNKDCPLDRSELARTATTLDRGQTETRQGVRALAAYPNPFASRAVIEFALKNSEEYSVKLYNIVGKEVRSLKTGTAKAGELIQVTLDNAGLAEGLYLVRLTTKTETQAVKLALKK